MKLTLILILLPIAAFSQKKEWRNDTKSVQRIYSVVEGPYDINAMLSLTRTDTPLLKSAYSEFYIYCQINEKTEKIFYAVKKSDTLTIMPTPLDTLAIRSRYIKIAGKVFEVKQ